jgi:hypothetical protein
LPAPGCALRTPPGSGPPQRGLEVIEVPGFPLRRPASRRALAGVSASVRETTSAFRRASAQAASSPLASSTRLSPDDSWGHFVVHKPRDTRRYVAGLASMVRTFSAPRGGLLSSDSCCTMCWWRYGPRWLPSTCSEGITKALSCRPRSAASQWARRRRPSRTCRLSAGAMVSSDRWRIFIDIINAVVLTLFLSLDTMGFG